MTTRPTVAMLRDLDQTARQAVRAKQDEERRHEETRARLATALEESAALIDKLAGLDPQAKAIGQIVPVLEELQLQGLRGLAEWHDPSSDDRAEVADAIGQVLVFLGARFGVTLERRP